MANPRPNPYTSLARKIEQLQKVRAQYHDIKDQYEETSFELEESRINNRDTTALQNLKDIKHEQMKETRGLYGARLAQASKVLKAAMPSLPNHLQNQMQMHLDRFKEWGEDIRRSEMSEMKEAGVVGVEPRVPEDAPVQNSARSGIPRMSRIPSKLPGPTRLSTSRLPQPKPYLPELTTSQQPQVARAAMAVSKIQFDIQKHQDKLNQALVQKRERKAEETKAPRRAAKSLGFLERRNSSIRDTSGTAVRRTSRPLPKTPIRTRIADPEPPSASFVQKKMLSQQKKIADREVANQRKTFVASNFSADFLKLFGINANETLTDYERTVKDKEKTDESKKNTVKRLLSLYKKFLEDAENLDDGERDVEMDKFLSLVVHELKTLFKMIRIFRGFFRGASYKDDEEANSQFIGQVTNFFENEPTIPECKSQLVTIFKRLPDPDLKPRKSVREPLNESRAPVPATPMSSLKKPPSNPLLRQTLLRSFHQSRLSSSHQAADAVAEQVDKLQSFKERGENSKATVREKLNTFLSNFCQIFSRNHNKTRHLTFEVWSKPFDDNIHDILEDLEDFYTSLPHTEGKGFHYNTILSQFQTFLFHLYEDTRSRPFEAGECKELVGERIEASAEFGRLLHLEKSLKIFVNHVQNLLNPYINESEIRLNTSMQTPQRRSLPKKSLIRPPSKLEVLRSGNKSMETPRRPSTAPSAQRKSARFDVPSRTRIPSATPGSSRRDSGPIFETPRAGSKTTRPASTPYSTKKKSESQDVSRRSVRQVVEDALEVTGGDSEIREVDEIVHQGLLKIVLMSKKIKQEFCQVLSNPDDLDHFELEAKVYDPIRELKDLFEEILYGGNDEIYQQEMQELDNDFVALGIHALTRKLRDQKVEIGDCSQILRVEFDTTTLPDDDIRRDLANFWRKFETFQSKYSMMVINKKEENLQASVSSRKSPKVIASKLKTAVRPVPGTRKPPRQIKPPPPPKPKPTILPFQYIVGLDVPKDVIERDILYVACQLLERDNDSFPLQVDKIIQAILQIARNFKKSFITKKVALKTISVIFWQQACVTVEFLNVFVYHPNNELFDAIDFAEPHTESSIRSSILARRKLQKCATDKAYGTRQRAAALQEFANFMAAFDDDIDTLARDVALVASGKYKPKFSMKKLMGNVRIRGSEKSNADDLLLAIPTKINGEIVYVARGLAGGMPDADFANDSILGDSMTHDGRLTQQANNANYLEASKIHRKGIKHFLQPKAIDRQNFWQARGGNLPCWFPGFFTVFKDSYYLKPSQVAPESVLLHAWRTMAPLTEIEA